MGFAMHTQGFEGHETPPLSVVTTQGLHACYVLLSTSCLQGVIFIWFPLSLRNIARVGTRLNI